MIWFSAVLVLLHRTGVDVFRGLYLSWKSLIQSSEGDDDEFSDDADGVFDDNDAEEIFCFLRQNLGLRSLTLGTRMKNFALFIENPTS